MNEYFDLIKKHGCDVKILSKNGNDTKINFSSIVDLVKSLEDVKASNESTAKQEILNIFEELLKQRNEV